MSTTTESRGRTSDTVGGHSRGYDTYVARSRSRGDALEPRGEKYGRGDRDALPLDSTKAKRIEDGGKLGGPDQDMQRGH